MIKRRCSYCRKMMEFNAGEHIRHFCSKQCFDLDREKRFSDEKSGPPMKPLTAEDITDDGYVYLVKEIVKRAGRDVTKFKPGTMIRKDAENFFQSDWFNALTGLDGEAVLHDLQKQYEENRHKEHGYKPRPVLCVESGVVYESASDAATEFDCDPKAIWGAMNGRYDTAAGLHWRYAEETE